MIRLSILIPLILFICCSESDRNKDSVGVSYKEKHRPQFHFSPEKNWMNNPNGLIFYEGEYHMFYQHNPDANIWGSMHWGHAVSSDLIHWEQLPVALFPDKIGDILSGSVVIDKRNSSGLGTDNQAPMVAIFTQHNDEAEKSGESQYQKQSIAYSLDKGRTWEKYEGNPVLENPGYKDFRDPKVLWHRESRQWIMVLAAFNRIRIYASKNLIDWDYKSEFGKEGDPRLLECPDLFPISVRGTDEIKWILMTGVKDNAPNGGSGTSYRIGNFDGEKFIADTTDEKWLDWGSDNYAFGTWSNLPNPTKRVYGIGWMNNWQYAQEVPTDNWRGSMTLPRELRLYKNNDRYILKSTIVRQFEVLEKEVVVEPNTMDRGQMVFDISSLDQTFKLKADLSNAEEGLDIIFDNANGNALKLRFNPFDNMVYVDRNETTIDKFNENYFTLCKFPYKLGRKASRMELYMDHSSFEIIFDRGIVSFTDVIYPDELFTKLTIRQMGNNSVGNRIKFKSIDGIWE